AVALEQRTARPREIVAVDPAAEARERPEIVDVVRGDDLLVAISDLRNVAVVGAEAVADVLVERAQMPVWIVVPPLEAQGARCEPAAVPAGLGIGPLVRACVAAADLAGHGVFRRGLPLEVRAEDAVVPAAAGRRVFAVGQDESAEGRSEIAPHAGDGRDRRPGLGHERGTG